MENPAMDGTEPMFHHYCTYLYQSVLRSKGGCVGVRHAPVVRHVSTLPFELWFGRMLNEMIILCARGKIACINSSDLFRIMGIQHLICWHFQPRGLGQANSERIQIQQAPACCGPTSEVDVLKAG